MQVRHCLVWAALAASFIPGCGPDRSLRAKVAVSEALAGSSTGIATSEDLIVLVPAEAGVFAITPRGEVFWYEEDELYTANDLAAKAAPEIPRARQDILSMASSLHVLAPGPGRMAVDAVDALVRPLLGEDYLTKYDSAPLVNGQVVCLRNDEIFWWDAGEVYAVNSSAHRLLPELPSAPEAVTLDSAIRVLSELREDD